MDDNDIREERSGRHQDLLLGFAPPATDSASATGIECMMALIRSINRMMPHSERDASLPERRAEESQNPLMRQAWQGADHLKQVWTLADKTELVRKIGFTRADKAPFGEIATMLVMDSTLWARPDHILSDRLIGRPDARRWELADDPDQERARRSLIRIQHQAGSGPVDLTAEIRRIFDRVEVLPDGSHQKFLARPPVYARILYAPADDAASDSLEALQVIHIKDEGQEEDVIDDGVDRLMWRYVLVAAVRLRSRPDDHDRIRLFTTNGVDIAWNVKSAYSDTDWHVGAPGHSYFLLYAHSEDVTKAFSHEERMDICRDSMYTGRQRKDGKDAGKVAAFKDRMGKALDNAGFGVDQTGPDLSAPKPWEVRPSTPARPEPPWSDRMRPHGSYAGQSARQRFDSEPQKEDHRRFKKSGQGGTERRDRVDDRPRGARQGGAEMRDRVDDQSRGADQTVRGHSTQGTNSGQGMSRVSSFFSSSPQN
ncbi:hypothetical protein QIS74_11190 [Colletotrichum tabaci]|uniref:Uncharacterized protein n=1 Tax=Colletotrichum tabaci TaxID=1209068 RepID=A0AAV9SXR1_9PEZI